MRLLGPFHRIHKDVLLIVLAHAALALVLYLIVAASGSPEEAVALFTFLIPPIGLMIIVQVAGLVFDAGTPSAGTGVIERLLEMKQCRVVQSESKSANALAHAITEGTLVPNQPVPASPGLQHAITAATPPTEPDTGPVLDTLLSWTGRHRRSSEPDQQVGIDQDIHS